MMGSMELIAWHGAGCLKAELTNFSNFGVVNTLCETLGKNLAQRHASIDFLLCPDL
jgi:hypothetical protein